MKASANLLKSVAVAGFALTLTANSQITIPLTPKTKVVFKELIEEGISYVVATVTIKENNPDGTVTYTTKEEKTGDSQKVVTDVTMNVNETSPGVFTVTTQKNTYTTPIDGNGAPTGPTEEVLGEVVTTPNVPQQDLDLPQVTTLDVSGEDLEEPPVVSEL